MEADAVAPHVQEGLVDAVATLAEIHGLEVGLAPLELRAPGRVVVDAGAEGEGIAGAQRAPPARRRRLGVGALGPRSLAVDREIATGPVEVLEPRVGNARPSEL